VGNGQETHFITRPKFEKGGAPKEGKSRGGSTLGGLEGVVEKKVGAKFENSFCLQDNEGGFQWKKKNKKKRGGKAFGVWGG